jgi:hypothetical protein
VISKAPIASTSIASLKNAGVTFAAGVLGVLTLIGLTPTLDQTNNNAIAADLGTITLTQLVPTLDQQEGLVAPLGTITLTQLVPTLTQGNSQAAPLGTLTLTQLLPTLDQSESEVAPLGTITLTGLLPTFAQSGVTSTVTPVGGGKRGRGTRKQYIEVDGQYYEVRDQAHAEEVLAQLYELAQENAAKLAKAASKPKRPRKNFIEPITEPPLLKSNLPDLQPTLDALSAQIDEMYKAAIRGQLALEAYQAQQAQDEDDAIVLLLH